MKIKKIIIIESISDNKICFYFPVPFIFILKRRFFIIDFKFDLAIFLLKF